MMLKLQRFLNKFNQLPKQGETFRGNGRDPPKPEQTDNGDNER